MDGTLTRNLSNFTQKDKFFIRDLSWMRFNERVLMEAERSDVPLMERLKFLAIYSSNLDEFTVVRIANLRRMALIDKTRLNKEAEMRPKRTLTIIREELQDQLSRFGKCLTEEVLPGLEREGVRIVSPDQLNEDQKGSTNHFFRTQVLAYMRPAIFEGQWLKNGELFFALRLKSGSDERMALLNIPSSSLPRFYSLPSGSGIEFIYLDDVIKMHLSSIFPGEEVLECRSIKLNRDADLNIENEWDIDLVEKIREQIQKRDIGVPCRLLYDRGMSAELLEFIQTTWQLEDEDLVPGGVYHNLSDFFQISASGSDSLRYPKTTEVRYAGFDGSILDSIEEQDHLLHFPYHSYNGVLQYFNAVAIDPKVTEIYTSFYRMASNSIIAEALISAANNGKKVTVFMELKARFDEANNLKWSDRLKQAGIKIIYSLPDIKVHAKIALVKRGEKWLSYVATGNLNEKTASIYSDFAYFTSNAEIGADLNDVFDYLKGGRDSLEPRKILVPRFNMIETYEAFIDREIENARAGLEARILLKMNNLEERGMISKLYEASNAGVQVDLLIRGICCLIPKHEGLSENIRVVRLLGPFLEHARIFWFHNNGASVCHIGSSDWMNRNLKHRVEVNTPILDKTIQSRLLALAELQLKDSAQAVELDSFQNNVVLSPLDDSKIHSQLETFNVLESWNM